MDDITVSYGFAIIRQRWYQITLWLRVLPDGSIPALNEKTEE